ncbi:MAG: hypothetical protein A2445_05745 [Candidatus Jacksonbacteria bacterium RIFOXYC2_FULL_44_29]|nr:MAG: Glycerophosphoryl diester phosphodiesterase [Parcubacteria group bacterium GW2011_GWC2_44_22]OGY76014.1 MAG: hypothetical protein A2240_05590 [Candidatus Jacksonbacteria bacterium RIFOXYA2_FULL_43_12]OGY76780.1 MAG: hypothetical protein A2295_00390 [Candidatus Jacksonbacteria bacterium RIFOXYB2_FULL_44_15]OGY79187.1 MAG: hypothetical protein A2445_05745 [Candidatus Jacksonbacteria bacterium RIFOXYC2_FULL_44_29]OGY82094.1 MAG: hypothetical protein A2550_00135 [Candidatus Jacksonbacteria 
MLKIAHRGANRLAPENTLEAFQLAIELGADMIELDVRLSHDQQIMVIHDDKISDLSRSQINQTSWGHAIPTLEQTLTLIKNQAKIDIELKESHTLEPTVALVKGLKMISQVILTSFDRPTVIRLKQKYPAFKAGLIIAKLQNDELPNLLAQALEYDIDALVLHHRLITADLVLQVKSANCQIYAWTVNDKKELARLATLGINGLATDDLTIFNQ